ncbi:amidohydrolase family protein, partial [Candidatus Bathyarchaeota archaeon]|nr:amidohydrolase family protein [Candidatus Bathyarchaeota archaeon]
MGYDLLIKNGRIIDGSGNPWYKADVGVIGDKIENIGDLDGDSDLVIDAKGLILSPGFIDIHSHSDIPILVDYHAHSKIRQGVTTEIIGNCGNSAAPMNNRVKEYRDRYARSRVPDDFKYDWITMEDYINRLESQGTSLNIVPLLGHGTIRMNVIGHENRAPTDYELHEMKNLVSQGMDDGAWGMSTGLIYPPSVYAKIEEIIELTKIVADKGGVYFSHIRGEGETLLDAVSEACEIGLQGTAPVQIAHFKSSGKPNWGKVKLAHELLEKYRDKSVDVTFDQYPYIASSTNVTAILPHWTQEGGAEKLLEHLKDPQTRYRIRNELRLNYEWDEILVTSAKNHPEYDGKNLKEVGEMMGKDPFNAVCDLLIMEDAQVPSVMFGMNEEDVEWVMKSP